MIKVTTNINSTPTIEVVALSTVAPANSFNSFGTGL